MVGKTCSTCHYWFNPHGRRNRGDCVLHNGLIDFKGRKLDFKGMLSTLPDFGCTEWRKDERKEAQP